MRRNKTFVEEAQESHMRGTHVVVFNSQRIGAISNGKYSNAEEDMSWFHTTTPGKLPMRKAKNISSYLCGAADLNGVTICCCKDIEKICQEVAAYGDLQITQRQNYKGRNKTIQHYAAIPAETTTSVLFLTTALPPIFERTEILIASLVLNGLLFFVICILMCKICQCCCFLERQDDEDDEGGDKSVHGSTRATPIPLDGGISCPNMVIPPFMEGTAQAQVQNASQPTSTAANPAFAFIAARPTSQPAFRQTGSAAAVARSSATA
ncbi:hypothetical protein Tcan_15135 [Toxocara canis]|uniref:Uncharacterized protein n=1 Tax=Toxocara canis TaxID=6265 RepID=A0A0B2V2I5_TOXCA|nr:hypothetical protein Tcan_15135 [Toxocara canis]